MTTAAAITLAAAGVLALVDWWSVFVDRPSVERMAKPGTMVLLILVALLIDPLSPLTRTWFVVGLILSLIGDVFLLLKQDLFVAGLTSFLLAHIAYTTGLLLANVDAMGLLAGAVGAVVTVALLGRRIQSAASTTDSRLGIPVAAYIGAISAMLVAAAATTNTVAIGGAVLFYASDAILGWNRFVAGIRHGRTLTMITYHAAQALLVVALITL